MEFTDDREVELKIQPISEREGVEIEETKKPKILKATYEAYIARNQSAMYSAMNCGQGDYLYWIKNVEGPNSTKPTSLVLTVAYPLLRTPKT